MLLQTLKSHFGCIAVVVDSDDLFLKFGRLMKSSHSHYKITGALGCVPTRHVRGCVARDVFAKNQ